MKRFLVLALLSFSIHGISQSPRDSLWNDSTKFVFVSRTETQPVHISGDNQNLITRIYENLKYPRGKIVSGTTILSFSIDSSGNVIEPKVSSSADSYIDQQLLKEINNHKFIPGTLYRKKVETTMHLPIRICID